MNTTDSMEVATTRQSLELTVKLAKQNLEAAEAALAAFNELAEHNVFKSIEEACSTLKSTLRNRAVADCEGSYNCGAEEYTQEFMVDGVKYMATLKCEYNRHDKKYYYLDGKKFSYEVME